MIEEDKMIINDENLIGELISFVAKKQSYEADDGHNDDLVMCLVMFAWLTTQPYFKEVMSSDIRTDIYKDRIQQIEDEMVPFGFLQTGDEEDHEVDSVGDVWYPVNDNNNF
jgi:hypothetical protein